MSNSFNFANEKSLFIFSKKIDCMLIIRAFRRIFLLAKSYAQKFQIIKFKKLHFCFLKIKLLLQNKNCQKFVKKKKEKSLKLKYFKYLKKSFSTLRFTTNVRNLTANVKKVYHQLIHPVTGKIFQTNKIFSEICYEN